MIQNQNKLFPVFLKLENFHLLIVGGGKIGLEKILAVLTNSPATPVTLVATHILPEIKKLTKQFPNLILKEKHYEDSDLEGKELVITATGDRLLGEKISIAAHQKKILINVADTPDLCDFYLGSVVQKGDLKIAISTNGKSPTIAKRIKEILQESIPEEIQGTLENMNIIRGRLKNNLEEKIIFLNKITSSLVPTKHIGETTLPEDCTNGT